MNEKEFLEWCKQEVCDYTNRHLDKTDKKQITTDNVFMVWSCKTLQNNKALLYLMECIMSAHTMEIKKKCM